MERPILADGHHIAIIETCEIYGICRRAPQGALRHTRRARVPGVLALEDLSVGGEIRRLSSRTSSNLNGRILCICSGTPSVHPAFFFSSVSGSLACLISC